MSGLSLVWIHERIILIMDYFLGDPNDGVFAWAEPFIEVPRYSMPVRPTRLIVGGAWVTIYHEAELLPAAIFQ